MNNDLNEATLYLLEVFDMMNKREEEKERDAAAKEINK